MASFGRARGKSALLVATSALALSVAVGHAKADYVVTPPASVPTSFTESTPITPPANLVPGLTASLWTLSPGLTSGGPGNLEGGPGTSGYPNLQGMANLETLAQTGTITTLLSGAPGTGAGALTYTASPYFSFTDTAINAYHFVAIAGGGNPIQNVLDGAGNSLATNLVNGITLPSSASTTPWNNLIFDQSGYVHVAFFDRTPDASEPDYEVGMRYWENGVADELEMDFGDFVMTGKLADFKLAAPRRC